MADGGEKMNEEYLKIQLIQQFCKVVVEFSLFPYACRGYRRTLHQGMYVFHSLARKLYHKSCSCVKSIGVARGGS